MASFLCKLGFHSYVPIGALGKRMRRDDGLLAQETEFKCTSCTKSYTQTILGLPDKYTEKIMTS